VQLRYFFRKSPASCLWGADLYIWVLGHSMAGNADVGFFLVVLDAHAELAYAGQDKQQQVECAEKLRAEVTWLEGEANATGPFFLGADFSLVDATLAPWFLRQVRMTCLLLLVTYRHSLAAAVLCRQHIANGPARPQLRCRPQSRSADACARSRASWTRCPDVTCLLLVWHAAALARLLCACSTSWSTTAAASRRS